jgi:predicted LPLAT superfamily acyltransferase
VSWTSEPERGSQLLLRFMIKFTLGLGWRVGNALLYPITAYFLLSSASSRAASRRFLAAALGRRPRLADLFRHHFTFAATILDRAFLLTGRIADYEIRVSGLEHVRDRVEAGQGCILLGAHLGSFEVLRALADQGCPVPVKALMYDENAVRITEVFNALNPGRAASVIRIGTPDALLRVREALAAGELVGMLGDRIVGGDTVVAVDFLGRPALLPTGPIVLAGVLGAPVVLFFGIHRGGQRYDISFEPFAEALEVGHRAREADVTGWVRRYAARLEAACRAHPYNWFNFYDFWGEQQDGRSTAGAGPCGRLPLRGGTLLRRSRTLLLGRGRNGRPDAGVVAGQGESEHFP